MSDSWLMNDFDNWLELNMCWGCFVKKRDPALPNCCSLECEATFISSLDPLKWFKEPPPAIPLPSDC